MNKNISDEKLVEMCINEDKEYFGELIKRYQEKLFYYIKRISSVNNEDAEDILQNSFVNAFKKIKDFDSKLKFSSWIYRIVRNQVIDSHRKSKSKGRDSLISIDDDILNNISGDFDTITLTENELVKEYIQIAINNMSKKYSEVIILRYFEEKDYNEISDILKKPVNTIATLLSRAKKQLKIEINNLTNKYYE